MINYNVYYLVIITRTNRLKRLALDRDIDFTDHHYQLSLPMHARATASMAVKTNLKSTEFVTEPNMITCQQKVSVFFFNCISNLKLPLSKLCHNTTLVSIIIYVPHLMEKNKQASIK